MEDDDDNKHGVTDPRLTELSPHSSSWTFDGDSGSAANFFFVNESENHVNLRPETSIGGVYADFACGFDQIDSEDRTALPLEATTDTTTSNPVTTEPTVRPGPVCGAKPTVSSSSLEDRPAGDKQPPPKTVLQMDHSEIVRLCKTAYKIVLRDACSIGALDEGELNLEEDLDLDNDYINSITEKHKLQGRRTECTKDSLVVPESFSTLSQMMFNVRSWPESLRNIVYSVEFNSAPTKLEDLLKRSLGASVIRVVNEELHVPVPFLENSLFPKKKEVNCWKGPSGIILHRSEEGSCKVTWIENIYVQNVAPPDPDPVLGPINWFCLHTQSSLFHASRWLSILMHELNWSDHADFSRGSLLNACALMKREYLRLINMSTKEAKWSNSHDDGKIRVLKDSRWDEDDLSYIEGVDHYVGVSSFMVGARAADVFGVLSAKYMSLLGHHKLSRIGKCVELGHHTSPNWIKVFPVVEKVRMIRSKPTKENGMAEKADTGLPVVEVTEKTFARQGVDSKVQYCTFMERERQVLVQASSDNLCHFLLSASLSKEEFQGATRPGSFFPFKPIGFTMIPLEGFERDITVVTMACSYLVDSLDADPIELMRKLARAHVYGIKQTILDSLNLS